MAKLFFSSLLAIISSAPLVLAVDPSRLAALHHEEAPHYHDVSTEALKAWVDAGKKLIIVDVRTNEYDDGNRLPGAIFLPYNAAESQLAASFPAKDAEIVVYCTSPSCTASKYMADRLVALGYTNVYKYPDGIQGWMKAGYPITKEKK